MAIINCGPEVRKEVVKSALADNQAFTVKSIRPNAKKIRPNAKRGKEDGEDEEEEDEEGEDEEEGGALTLEEGRGRAKSGSAGASTAPSESDSAKREREVREREAQRNREDDFDGGFSSAFVAFANSLFVASEYIAGLLPGLCAIYLASTSPSNMGGPLQFLVKLAFVGDMVSFYRSTTMDGATPLLLWVKVLSVALVCASGWYTLRAGLVRARARLSARVNDLNGPNGSNGPSGNGRLPNGHDPLSGLGSGCDLSGFSVLVTGLPPDITRTSSAHEVADVFSIYGEVVHVAIGLKELGKVEARHKQLSKR